MDWISRERKEMCLAGNCKLKLLERQNVKRFDGTILSVWAGLKKEEMKVFKIDHWNEYFRNIEAEFNMIKQM